MACYRAAWLLMVVRSARRRIFLLGLLMHDDRSSSPREQIRTVFFPLISLLNVGSTKLSRQATVDDPVSLAQFLVGVRLI